MVVCRGMLASLDPGTKSGLVFWEGELRRHSGAEIRAGLREMFEIREESWFESAARIARDVHASGAQVLLYEDFVLRGGGGHSSEAEALDSVRVTSGVVCLLEEWGWDGHTAGFNASIKAVMTDERMKKWGLWLQGRGSRVAGTEGFEGHATDAARGLVWYLREVVR